MECYNYYIKKNIKTTLNVQSNSRYIIKKGVLLRHMAARWLYSATLKQRHSTDKTK